MQNPIRYIFIGSFVVVLLSASMSCGNRKTNDTECVDTLSGTEYVSPAIKMLPDTVFLSANVVDFKVAVADTLISGALESLENLYASNSGWLTFRGGQHRDAQPLGRIVANPTEIDVLWTFRTAEDYSPTKYGAWGGGTGWTGQPLYVEWPDSLISKFPRGFSKKELIVGSLCGKVYFLDFETGKQTRPEFDTGNPIKGTPSLDPTMNGNLYVGQGVPSHREIGALVYDLFSHKEADFFGPDPKAPRRWYAYDSSPVRVDRFLFRPGENGVLYKYSVSPGNIALHSSMRYFVGGRAPGMESSMSVYRNYGYIGDNAGNILCINLNNLKPVWYYKLPDDVDATPVVTEEADGHAYIYVGCEVEHPGVSKAVFVKLDALNGQCVWKCETAAMRHNTESKHFDGGYYATALPGHGDCSHLIFVPCVLNKDGSDGCFQAINRDSGEVVYAIHTPVYSWSSPVGYLDSDNKFYVLTADCGGTVRLIEGATGRIAVRKHIGNNFESSPVVVDSTAVVGSRGNTIFKLVIR